MRIEDVQLDKTYRVNTLLDLTTPLNNSQDGMTIKCIGMIRQMRINNQPIDVAVSRSTINGCLMLSFTPVTWLEEIECEVINVDYEVKA